MKKVLSIVIAVVMVASLAASAFATASPSLSPTLPSPDPASTESSELLVPAIVGVVAYDGEGNVVELSGAESITIVNEAVKADAEVAAALDAAVESLKAAGTVDAIIPELAGMVVSDVIYVDGPADVADFLAKGGTITITLDMKAEPGTEMNAIVYKDGAWSLVDETWDTAVTVEENGDVNLTINQLGVYAVLSK